MRGRWHFALIGIAALSVATSLHAQQPPPIHGFNGTMATDATIKDEQKAAKKAAVATEDLVKAGDQKKGPLADLRPGATVVIHYNVDQVTEGVVNRIDWGNNEITVRYENKKTEKLQLADGVAIDAGRELKAAPDGSTKIVVYSDDTGHKIARYFKPKS